jgi:lipopolysaccharide/colanic/teichoic acid biosynthesis glycosyltransferase
MSPDHRYSLNVQQTMTLHSPSFNQAIAAIALFFALPLFAVGAVVTWFLVGSPLLFRQTRAGVNGTTFEIYKFRTMTNATGADGNLLPDHQRTNFMTRLMRRSRLDELPQLISILRAEMDIVGPRPLLPQTVSEMGYPGTLRNSIKPGLTGWSQINGNTQLNNSQKLALDVWYVAHRTFWLDCKIVVKTVLTVIIGEKVNMNALALAEDYLEHVQSRMPGSRDDR